jgi:hypothetical protein
VTILAVGAVTLISVAIHTRRGWDWILLGLIPGIVCVALGVFLLAGLVHAVKKR